MSAPKPGRVRVYRMPAERLLGSLPAGSIDVLITDPPYTSVDRHRGTGHLRDWFRGGMGWAEIGRVLALARRKMKPTGLAFVMTNPDGLRDALGAMTRAGFRDVRTITWDRQWPGLGTGLRHQTEFILLGRLPRSRPVSGLDLLSVKAVGPGTADRYPTEKPEGLGRELARIAGVHRGDLVVDPFCGSGALLRGALELGGTVVGGDISARAVQRATARLTGPAKPGVAARPVAQGRRRQTALVKRAPAPRPKARPRSRR